MFKKKVLLAGEIIIREGTAVLNSSKDVGGSLILTNLRLLFVSFKRNKTVCSVPLSEVLTNDDNFGIHCDIPNRVELQTREKVHRFTVKCGEKSAWENDISKAIEKIKSNKTERER